MVSIRSIIVSEGANELNVGLTPIVVPIYGSIEPGWLWHEGLVANLAIISGMEIPLNVGIYLGPEWLNESAVNIVGHVDLSVTYPDGTKHTLSATANQDREAAPGSGYLVEFQPFTSSQEGTYTLEATLSSDGKVLDSVTFTLITVPAIATLYGIVTDAVTGSPLDRVTITLDGKVTLTNAMGEYWFDGIGVGEYTITFEKVGYETLVR